MVLSRAMTGPDVNYDIIHMLLDAGAVVEHSRVRDLEPLKLLNCCSWSTALSDHARGREARKMKDIQVAERICKRSTTIGRPNERPNDSLILHYINRQRGDLAALVYRYGARRTWGPDDQIIPQLRSVT